MVGQLERICLPAVYTAVESPIFFAALALLLQTHGEVGRELSVRFGLCLIIVTWSYSDMNRQSPTQENISTFI